MSWIQKLYETYEVISDNMEIIRSGKPLIPVGHTSQQAHIEIVLDEDGNFLRAKTIPKDESDTVVPATEESAGRSSGGAPHPLCDKIQYVAGDYLEYGGEKKAYFADFLQEGKLTDGYLNILRKWHNEKPNPKLNAVLNYVSQKKVIRDLIKEQILYTDENGRLITSWPSRDNVPHVFRLLTKKKGVQDQGDAFVRWRVEMPGNLDSTTWEDTILVTSWMDYYQNLQGNAALCFVAAEERPIATNHPARLRYSGDKAKLISSNDAYGFTYRGRFVDASQACGVSYEVSQKAHSALRWLIDRQSYRGSDGQVIVSWAVSGNPIPDPLANSFDLFGEGSEELVSTHTPSGDIGQAFAIRLAKKIKGYRVELGSTDEIVVMGLDSAIAGKGRMAIIYYREITNSEFLDRVEAWHQRYAWHQNYSREKKFIGAPAPEDIAEAAYGRRLDEKIRKATVERLLPCVIDGRAIPRDLVEITINRATNRNGMKNQWEWEKVLGIACALFKGFHNERGYQMTLEADRKTRDYLYGWLLAIAEHMESRALFFAGEKRVTTAEKLMQRFADHPYSTWLTIEKALVPYKARLQSRSPGFLKKMNDMLDEVHGLFQRSDYMYDGRLSGEFLLGYHCQRQKLREKYESISAEESIEE